MRFDRPVHAAPLVLALLPAVAAAQPRPGGTAPPPGGPARGSDGVEIAAGATIAAIYPTIGGQVSIPATSRLRVEVGTHVLSWMLERGEQLATVTHVQTRMPFRHGPPGSRRSLIVGASVFTLHRYLYSKERWEYKAAVRPHAGMSWQWQQSRNLDVRIDLQGLFTAPFVVPLASFSVVWHRERRWS